MSLSNIGLIMFGDQFNLAKTFTSWRRTQIKADGTFRFAALHSGELNISPDNRILGLEIAQIEKDDVSFENVAFGDYFLSTEIYTADRDVVQKSAIPKFWNLEKRSQLFQSAKNEMNNLTVKPCQNSAIETESVVK